MGRENENQQLKHLHLVRTLVPQAAGTSGTSQGRRGNFGALGKQAGRRRFKGSGKFVTREWREGSSDGGALSGLMLSVKRTWVILTV